MNGRVNGDEDAALMTPYGHQFFHAVLTPLLTWFSCGIRDLIQHLHFSCYKKSQALTASCKSFKSSARFFLGDPRRHTLRHTFDWGKIVPPILRNCPIFVTWTEFRVCLLQHDTGETVGHHPCRPAVFDRRCSLNISWQPQRRYTCCFLVLLKLCGDTP